MTMLLSEREALINRSKLHEYCGWVVVDLFVLQIFVMSPEPFSARFRNRLTLSRKVSVLNPGQMTFLQI